MGNRFGYGSYVIRRRDERGLARRIEAEVFIDGCDVEKRAVRIDDSYWRDLTLQFGDGVSVKLTPRHAEMLGLALLTWGAATADDRSFEKFKNKRPAKRRKASK